MFTAGPPAPRPTLDNFVYVLTEVPFWRYLINTFVVSAMRDGGRAVLPHHGRLRAGAAALPRARSASSWRCSPTFLVSLPVIIVPLFILVRSLMGMLNSWQGLIVPAIFNAFGIFLLRQYYLSLPRETGGGGGDRRRRLLAHLLERSSCR